MSTVASTTARSSLPPDAAQTPAPSTRLADGPSAFDTLKKVLKPIASLRLTVALLSMSILLVFCGTSAQKELGIGDVLTKYFYSWWCFIPSRYLLPLASWAWESQGGKPRLPGGFYFPGGYTLMAALLVNLLAAHTVRFKLNAKRSGVLLIHFGLILLLVGELLTSKLKQEDQLTFREGDTRQWVHNLHKYEIAVVESGAGAKGADKVTVVGGDLLRNDQVVNEPQLPFTLKIDKWYENAQLAGPMQQDKSIDRLATVGALKDRGLIGLGKFTGVEAEQVDAPGAFVTVTPKEGGPPIGTLLLTVFHGDNPQQVVVGDKKYDIALRFERTYLPYSITLLDFTHDKYAGTEVARNFASRITLDDPDAGAPREVTIRMNEPLRYGGLTYFQSGFDPADDKVTTLQVVDNPAWTMPYIACVVGTIGMLIHFGILLVNFLRKRSQEQDSFVFNNWVLVFALLLGPIFGWPLAVWMLIRRRQLRRLDSQTGSDQMQAAHAKSRTRRGEAEPRASLAGGLIPAGVVAVFALYVLSVSLRTPKVVEGKPVLATLGEVPVQFDGRVMPVDTLARSALKIIHNKQEFRAADGTKVPAMVWLADVMSGKPEADDYRVFRIDHPDVKSMLGLDELVTESRKNWEKGDPEPLDGKNFSFANILYGRPGNGAALQKQVDAARNVPSKRRNLYQLKVMDLYEHLSLHMRLSQVAGMVDLYDTWSDGAAATAFATQAQALMGVDPATMSPEQRALMRRFDRVDQQLGRLRQLQQSPEARTQDLYFIPPAKADEAWGGLGQAMIAAANAGDMSKLDGNARTFLTLMRDYRDGATASFNTGAPQYAAQLALAVAPQAATSSYEAFFNRFDPFYQSLILYVFAFLFVIISWIAWQVPMWRTAGLLLLLALVVHTIGLVMRVQISGRPPVTNLYSSAVFIAWGAVVMAALFEIVFRNGIGFAVASVVGALSLLIAGGLATEGDTMKQLQAVLDTNFWLATHVVVITLGYAATFLAMGLALAYVILGMATPMVDADLRKNLTRMVYGVMCFGMLFSFVGTVLGGIWADQSWGRFWGWDPKENGAVLIVLWVALVLHARWGGLVKERGIMALTILGGIVTAWSWFGTNMMGVGLHSYGFMESGVFWLGAFTLFDLTVVGVALSIPQRMWWSFQQSATDAGAASGKRGFAPVPKP